MADDRMKVCAALEVEVAQEEAQLIRDRIRALIPQPAPTISPAEAAKVLLGDDILISKMAGAVHDGPLGADEYQFTAATSQGAWCVDVVRAALRAIAEDRT